ncbi:hypothetical protein WICPIJ_000192 [Wickerhamomyces pijperi]|uniref:Uncharacterized protein n=1 Tax=Wickerhamomyces pijperi TaxID=599730 RepID=A0A9P8QD41_WICPI|nr:hypothetical protein WICPIJ_000192 [Wickerhamomyces pijperi]
MESSHGQNLPELPSLRLQSLEGNAGTPSIPDLAVRSTDPPLALQLTQSEMDESVSDSEEESQDLLIKPKKLAILLKRSDKGPNLLKLKKTNTLPSSLEKIITEAQQNKEHRRIIEINKEFQRPTRRSKDAYQRHPYVGELIEHTLQCSRAYACELLDSHESVLVSKFKEGKNVFQMFLVELVSNARKIQDTQSQSQELYGEVASSVTKKPKAKTKVARNISGVSQPEDIFAGIDIPQDNSDEDQDYDLENNNHISDDEADEEAYGVEDEFMRATQRRKKVQIIDDEESQKLDDESQETFQFRGHLMKKKNIAKLTGLPQSLFTLQSKNKPTVPSHSSSLKRTIREDVRGVAKKKKGSGVSNPLATPQRSLEDDLFITEEIIADDGDELFNLDVGASAVEGRQYKHFFDAISQKYADNAVSVETYDSDDSYGDMNDYFDDHEGYGIREYQNSEDEDNEVSDLFQRDFLVTDTDRDPISPTSDGYSGSSKKKHRQRDNQPRIGAFLDKASVASNPGDYDFDDGEDYNNIYRYDFNSVNRQGEAMEASERIDYLLASGSGSGSGSGTRSSSGTNTSGTPRLRTKGANSSSSSSSSRHEPSRANRTQSRSRSSPSPSPSSSRNSGTLSYQGRTNQPKVVKRAAKSQVFQYYDPSLGPLGAPVVRENNVQPTLSKKAPNTASRKKNGLLTHFQSNLRLVLPRTEPLPAAMEEASNEIVRIPIRPKITQIQSPATATASSATDSDSRAGLTIFAESTIYKYLILNKPFLQRQEYILTMPDNETKILFSKRSMFFLNNFQSFSDSLLHYTTLQSIRTHRINFALFQEFLTTFLTPENLPVIVPKLHEFLKRLDVPKTRSLYAWYMSQILICYKVVSKYCEQHNVGFVELERTKKLIVSIFNHLMGPGSDHPQLGSIRPYLLRDTLDICFQVEPEMSWAVIHNQISIKNVPMWLFIWEKYRDAGKEVDWGFVMKILKNLGFKYLLPFFIWVSKLSSKLSEEITVAMFQRLSSLKFEYQGNSNSNGMVLLTPEGKGLKPINPVNVYINCFMASDIQSSRAQEQVTPTANSNTEKKEYIIDRVNIYLALAVKFGHNYDHMINNLLVKLDLLKALEVILTMTQINEKNKKLTKFTSLDDVISRVIRYQKFGLWSNFIGFLKLDSLNMKSFHMMVEILIKYTSNQQFMHATKDVLYRYLQRLDVHNDRTKIEKFRLLQSSSLTSDIPLWVLISKRMVEAKLCSWNVLLDSVSNNDDCPEIRKLDIFRILLKSVDGIFAVNSINFLTILVRSIICFKIESIRALNELYKELNKDSMMPTSSPAAPITAMNRWTILQRLIPFFISLRPNYRAQIFSMMITTMNVLMKEPQSVAEGVSLHVAKVLRQISKYKELEFVKNSIIFKQLSESVNFNMDGSIKDNVTDEADDMVIALLKLFQSVIGAEKSKKLASYEKFLDIGSSTDSRFESLKLLLQALLRHTDKHNESWVYLTELASFFKMTVLKSVHYNPEETFQILHFIKLIRFALISEEKSLRFHILSCIYPVIRLMYYVMRGYNEYYVFKHVIKDYMDEKKILGKFGLAVKYVKVSDTRMLDAVGLVLRSRRVAYGGEARTDVLEKMRGGLVEYIADLKRLVERESRG